MRKSNVTEETNHYSAMRRLILSAMIGLPLALLVSVHGQFHCAAAGCLGRWSQFFAKALFTPGSAS